MAYPQPQTFDELLTHLIEVHKLPSTADYMWDMLGVHDLEAIHNAIHDQNTRIHHHMPAAESTGEGGTFWLGKEPAEGMGICDACGKEIPLEDGHSVGGAFWIHKDKTQCPNVDSVLGWLARDE